VPIDHGLMLISWNALEYISVGQRRDLLAKNCCAAVKKMKIKFSVFLSKGHFKLHGSCDSRFCISLPK